MQAILISDTMIMLQSNHNVLFQRNEQNNFLVLKNVKVIDLIYYSLTPFSITFTTYGVKMILQLQLIKIHVNTIVDFYLVTYLLRKI